MTLQPRLIIAITALAAGLTTASCATPKGSSGRPHSISIFVKNNLTIPTVIDVFIIGPAGTEWRLGQVAGGDSAEFSYRPDSYGQRYRLIGKRPLQRPVVSTPFTFGDPKTRLLYWSLNSGIVTAYEDVAVTDTILIDTTKKVSP